MAVVGRQQLEKLSWTAKQVTKSDDLSHLILWFKWVD